MSYELDVRRRRLVLGGIAAGLGLFVAPAQAQSRQGMGLPDRYADPSTAAAFWAHPRVINVVRKATGEHRRVCFWRDGALDAVGYKEACYALRDVRAGEVFAMDLSLLNLLCGMQGWLYSAYGIT